MPEKFKEEVEFFRHSSKLERSKFRDENIKMLAERIWKISGSKEGRDYENWKIAEYIYDFISETSDEVVKLESEKNGLVGMLNKARSEAQEIIIYFYLHIKSSLVLWFFIPKSIMKSINSYVDQFNLKK